MGGGTSFTRFLENIGLIQAEKQRLDFEVTDSGFLAGQRGLDGRQAQPASRCAQRVY
jgi:hypothetical protein